MLSYIVRRVLLIIPTLLLGTLLVFAVIRILPGDLALSELGSAEVQTGGAFNEAQYQELRQVLGLNDPLPVQYGKWLWSMADGNFGGRTLLANEPIRGIIALRLPKTAELAVLAFAFSLLLGIPLGIASALYHGRWQDYAIQVLMAGSLSLPSFWIALLVLLAGLVWFNWVPPIAYKSFLQDPWSNLQTMLLPALIIGINAGAFQCRVTRAAMLDVLRQDYIRTAQGKGLSQGAVVMGHALKNALIPSITLAGLNLTTLFGGTVILESIFGIPGMGTGLIQAVQTRDYPLVQSLATVFLAVTLFGNLLVDISYAWLDPRVKYT